MSTVVDAPPLSEDASAILLLCATLGKRRSGAEPPLTVSEYDAFANVLRTQGLRPRNLVLTDRPNLARLVDTLPAKMRERLSPTRIERLLERGGQLAFALTKWSSSGIWISTRADASYPSRYKQKLGRGAPPIVYGIGPKGFLELGGIAVVGSRDPDPMSEAYAQSVGHWAAEANVQVVSGAARGVDMIAMLSCTEAGGTAVGVVAESLLRLSTRREFREQIVAARLTLVSSFDPEAGFSTGNAMGRNRWLYALADRGLVVACTEGRGGTWAGAVEAIKRKVPVFVKTGNTERPGNQALLEYGGRAAPQDLSEMLSDASAPIGRGEPQQSGTDTPSAIPSIVSYLHTPATAKEIAVSLELTPAQVKVGLAKLLASGHVVKKGRRFKVASPDDAPPSGAKQMTLI